MNSNKQSCSTFKNTLIPEEPCSYTIPKPTTISDKVELIRQRHKHGELVLMKGTVLFEH